MFNAIASTTGAIRLLRRELESVAPRGVPGDGADVAATYDELDAAMQRNALELEQLRDQVTELDRVVASGDERILSQVRPHIETLTWLVGRVELVRAEMMNELRYGSDSGRGVAASEAEPAARVVNAAALSPADGRQRVNLGSGHLPIAGFVNVDVRELPGVDVVARVDDLPFEPGSLTEIYSAHTLEHFPEEELRRRLMPYWVGLLEPGGTFRVVVPDMEAMTKEYARGTMAFETLRNVAYGGQEYDGDFHFTGFTPATLSALLESSGLRDARVIASGRTNGGCLECEVVATRPSA